MVHLKKKIIRIHNPVMALPSFWFKGIEAYSTRAMTDCGGITIVADCGQPELILSMHDYLGQLGLGAEELILLRTGDDGDLYQIILNDKNLKERIFNLVTKENYKIEFFCTRDKIEENFINQLGLDWSGVASHPGDLADCWNDKSKLRKIAKQNNLAYLFPEHYIVNSFSELRYYAEKMLKHYKELVIKPPLWSSGLGMIFGSDITIVDSYRSQHSIIPEGTIIEQALPAEHLSMSIVTRFNQGVAVDRWFTEQYCSRQNSSIVYDGFNVGGLPNVTDADISWMKKETEHLYDVVLHNHPSVNGIINFDCLRDRHQRYVLECNARVTFSSYIQEIRHAVLKQKGIINNSEKLTKASCLVRKVSLKSTHDFKSLSSTLGETLLTDLTKSGVLPIIIGCLISGYCYLLAIADSNESVNQIMLEAQSKLEF